MCQVFRRFLDLAFKGLKPGPLVGHQEDEYDNDRSRESPLYHGLPNIHGVYGSFYLANRRHHGNRPSLCRVGSPEQRRGIGNEFFHGAGHATVPP